MGRKPQIQSRVEPDTKTQLDEYADRNGLTQSEAVRQLVGRQLAAEGYQIVVTDGGATLTDRLDEIEQQQEQASTTYTTTLAVGLGYVVLSVATGASGLLWGAVGVAALAAVVFATAARNMERDSE